MTKIFRKKRFWIVTVFTFLIGLSNSCLTFRKSNKQVYKAFAKLGQKPLINNFELDKQSIRYIEARVFNTELPTVIFVHGSPGSSQDFYEYIQDSTLYKKANLIVLDRLGYGYSEFGKTETSIAKQAAMIARFIKYKNAKKVILVGWSFGGAIVAKTAIINSNVSALLLLAPAVDPNHEKHFVLGYLAKWKATRWFVPKAFRVAEQEKLAHSAELELMLDDWSTLKIPVVHMHGDKDKLVPFENLAFSKKMISPKYLTPIVVKDAGHLLPWKNYKLVKEQIAILIKTIHQTIG